MRVRRFIPAFAWMAVIFIFSTSLFGSEQTGPILGWVVKSLLPGLPLADIDYAHLLLRKCAHFTEYAVLALLWRRGFRKEGLAEAKALPLALAVSALYAVTDEFHQSFVPNRTPSAVDVLVDSAGAAAGLAAVFLKQKQRNH